MNEIVITGSTGVIGQRAVRGLLAAGHDVKGVTRSARGRELLESLGASAVEADVFDESSLRRAFDGAQAVVNVLTHIPTADRMADPSAWEENDRIRTEASATIARAAQAAGVRRLVQESIAFVYADGGDAWLDEDAPVAGGGVTTTALTAERNARELFDGETVVLRFGLFTGPASGSTLAARGLQRGGASIAIGPPGAYRPTLALDDAAAAIVASRSLRLDTRCERAIGPSCGVWGRRAATPAAAASAASISAFVGGSASATLYVPAGARNAATMAAAASSSQSVGRYAPGGPSATEVPPRAASSAAREDPLSGPMNSPKRSTAVSPSNSSRALRSAVSAVVVTPPPATGASSSSHASPPSAYTNAIDSCTSRLTPAEPAARAIAADASVRTRSFSFQADGSDMRSALGTCVSRLTTASAPSNAPRNDAASNTSA